ncbi:glycosyltransferase family 4 protein [Pseudonocardia humida]|uniref:Glycosyltransferase family 4 protein n=1 Tax=Pseudonocardia humida TaxID=2800819 RepID=A0ABT0ZXQ8_9PSEU|nr:glycosyltransferase family 4 protein [Pseudonocardia humida]MCO1655532.1 glycosyltransferase family 4 protein [Pseudonocardia humida]
MRIALLSYRSKNHSGGQGVYVRQLSRGLAELGHEVEVFSGPPYPDGLDPRVRLTRVPSLDVFGRPDAPRLPPLRELGSAADVLEYLTTATGCFAEPLAFSARMARLMRERAGDFDVVHDNQSLGYGLLALHRRGIPVAATIHHPISRDRRIAVAAAPRRKKLPLRRWYGFVPMQARVARRLPVIVGVSEAAAADTVHDFRVDPARIRVVPLGVDVELFRPAGPRVPGRIVAVASADHPLKGVDHLLDAVAKLRADRDVELQLVSTLTPDGPTERRIAALGLGDCVHVRSGVTDAELAALLASAEVMCVPSRYEGFSLPTVEAMACGTPVVASRTGALPEVVGPDGGAGLLVPPGDIEALTAALSRVLGSTAERERLGAAGRARATERFSWTAVARATEAAYREAIAATGRRPC